MNNKIKRFNNYSLNEGLISSAKEATNAYILIEETILKLLVSGKIKDSAFKPFSNDNAYLILNETLQSHFNAKQALDYMVENYSDELSDFPFFNRFLDESHSA